MQMMYAKWSKREMQEVVDLYQTKTAREIAEHLGRSFASVRSKIVQLDLHVSPEEFHRRLSRAASANAGRRGELNYNWKGGVSSNHYKYKKVQKERYPDRVRARELVHKAKKSGKLIQVPCIICGCEQTEAHHDDYSKPLDVKWLCKKHHIEYHSSKVTQTEIR